ncbi:hypothetical protein (plasmid) [Citrobacter freundii]|nr:hypothetical protein [Citrobacter freundii]
MIFIISAASLFTPCHPISFVSGESVSGTAEEKADLTRVCFQFLRLIRWR